MLLRKVVQRELSVAAQKQVADTAKETKNQIHSFRQQKQLRSWSWKCRKKNTYDKELKKKKKKGRKTRVKTTETIIRLKSVELFNV